MTIHELDALEMFAERSGQPAERFRVVAAPEREVWYDFQCPATGKFGQCRLRADWTWHQEPRGTSPVLLAYDSPARKGGRC